MEGSILDLAEFCLYLIDISSKVLATYLKGSILDLKTTLAMFFSVVALCIEGPRTKLSIFFSCVLGEEVGGKRIIKVETACALSIATLF